MGFKTFNTRERIKSFAKDKTGYIKPTGFFFKLGSDIYNIFVSDHFFLGSL